MWTPSPEQVITAEQRATEAAVADRLAQYPNLEPDQFWFVVRASGYEADLLEWVETMEPVDRAAASAKLEFAKYFERDHPFIEAARVSIGMSETELDSLWQYGANS